MTPALREEVRQRFAFRCGYCGIAESDAGAELTIDHFQPVSRGGTDALENLVYACNACNQFKHDWWEPNAELRLLHPLRDDISNHVHFSLVGEAVGITPIGDFHIAKMHLNRPALIEHRLEKRAIAQERRRIAELTQELDALAAEFIRMGFSVPER